MKTFRIGRVVGVEQGYRSEVDLRGEISNPEQNEARLNAYVPTRPAVAALKEIGKALAPNWAQRARFLTGQYGSGKSHLGLVIANIFMLSADAKGLRNFITRLERKDEEAAKMFIQARWQGNIQEPFLIVLPDPQRDNFNMALLAALEKALKQAEISYQFKSYFHEAINKLDELVRDPELERRIVSELNKRQMNVAMLRSNLEKYRDEDFRTFVEIVRNATTMQFVPSAHATASPVFVECAKQVRKDGYAGILVIADEFGRHLTDMATSLQSSEALAIQEFAEACNDSRENQIHFIAIAHKTLADYASAAVDTDDWKKVAGRFTEHNLDYAQGQEEEMVDLISTVLYRKDSLETQKAYWNEIRACLGPSDDWVANTGLYQEMDKKWRREQLITGCYPLHPATVFCLPWLALRVGQRERTAIRFLSSDQDGSLVRFMASTPAMYAEKVLNLYTPEMLLDFFGPAARRHEQHSAEMRAYDEAYARFGHEEIAHRIVKLITVLTIVGQPALQATEKTIPSILGRTAKEREEIARVLDELELSGFVRLHKANGRYELPRRSEGDLPPREAIDRIKDEWSLKDFDPLAVIIRIRKETDIIASGYQDKKTLPRRASVSFVSPGHLANLAAPEETIKAWYEPGNVSYKGDALVWYVVAFDKEGVAQAEKALSKGTKTKQHIVAVPKLHFTRLEELKDLAAIGELHKRGHKIGDDVVDASALGRLEKQIEIEVNEAIEDYFRASNFQWHYGKNRNVSIKDGGEDGFLSGVFLELFPDTPPITDKAVTLGRITPGENAARKRAITKLIEVKGGALQIEKTGGPAENRILRSALLNTELFTKVNDLGHEIEIEVQQKVPARSVLSKVWRLIDSVLSREDADTHFGALVRTLLGPPYGLPAPLIELLLGAYLRYKRGNFQIFDAEQEVHEPSAALVEKIVRAPDDYALIYYEFTPAEEAWLRGIVDMMPAGDLPEVGLVEQARDALMGWVGGLPAGTRAAREQEKRVAAILELTDDKGRTADAKKLLLEYLPASLGFSDQGFGKADVPDMLTALQKSKDIADNYIQQRAQQAIEALCEVFSVEGRTLEALADGMLAWWNALRGDQRMHVYDADIQALSDRLRQGELREDGLLIELPRKMSLSPYTEWTDSKDVAMFVQKVSTAKLVIETYGGSPPPPLPPKPPSPEVIKKEILAVFDRFGIKAAERKKLLESLLKDLQE